MQNDKLKFPINDCPDIRILVNNTEGSRVYTIANYPALILLCRDIDKMRKRHKI